MTGILTSDGADYFLGLFSAGQLPVPFYYTALITGAQPGATITGDELDEPAFEDYVRAEYENVSGNWSIQDGVLLNEQEIAFPIAAQDWGTVNYWALCDAQFGGRVLYVGDTDPLEVLTGDQVTLPPGALALAMELPGWREEE